MRRTPAFTLVELLVVLVLLAILARVLLPVLLHARQAAFHTAARAYVDGVYKVATADYLETGQGLPTDCRHGYQAGGYRIADPGDDLLASCGVTVLLMPRVQATATTGESFSAP